MTGALSNPRLFLRRLLRKIWFRVSLFAISGILVAVAGILLGPLLPEGEWALIGSGSLDKILNILANSMLVVTIFSLTTLVSALVSATNNVTPRATRLLADDPVSQNVLGTFAGAFLFSLVAIIALGTESYGAPGRAILFGATLIVIAIVVVTLLRWIDYVAELGRVDDTTRKVELATERALKDRLSHLNLGGRPIPAGLKEGPAGACPVLAKSIGYCRSVDIAALDDCARASGSEIWLNVVPGTFVYPGTPLAYRVSAGSAGQDGESGDSIHGCFEIGDARSYDQDPRFGLCVLREIAQRALSPAINDPGTAIDIIGRAVRLLTMIGRSDPDQEPVHSRIWVPTETVSDFFDDVFPAIARDSAAMVEVHVHLQKALAALARTGHPDMGNASRRHASSALERFEAGPASEAEKAVVRRLHDRV